MKEDLPLITVLIRVYNGIPYLSEAIESVLSQSYQNFELLIVNDASTDSTLSLIKDYSEKDSRIKYHSMPYNTGACREPSFFAFGVMSGDFLVILDHDDLLEQNYLQKQLKRQQETNADIVIARMSPFGKEGRLNPLPLEGFDYSQILSGSETFLLTATMMNWIISLNGMMIKNSLFLHLEQEKYSPTYLVSDELDIRILVYHAQKVAFVDAKYYYRLTENSITRKISRRMFERLYVENQLIDYVQKKYGLDSDAAKRIRKEGFESLLFWQEEYFTLKSKYSFKDRLEIIKMLKENYNLMYRKLLQLEIQKSKYWKIAYLTNYTFFYITTSFAKKYLKKISQLMKNGKNKS